MTRRDEWRECVEAHASEGWGTTCDACLYLPEVYARMTTLEAGELDVERLAEALYLLGIEDTDLEGSANIAATIAAEYVRTAGAGAGMTYTLSPALRLVLSHLIGFRSRGDWCLLHWTPRHLRTHGE